MATKTRNIFVFYLLPMFGLMTALCCGPIPPENIFELKGVTAFVVVSPHKEVYSVGDTIALSIRAEKSKWNDWAYFEKAFFRSSVIRLGVDENIVELDDMAQNATNASFVDGDWVVEQKAFYVFKQSKIYVFDYSGNLSNTYYKGMSSTWHVSYTDNNRAYAADVPVYAADGKQHIELKVE